jgi:hypothetical protein
LSHHSGHDESYLPVFAHLNKAAFFEMSLAARARDGENPSNATLKSHSLQLCISQCRRYLDPSQQNRVAERSTPHQLLTIHSIYDFHLRWTRAFFKVYWFAYTLTHIKRVLLPVSGSLPWTILLYTPQTDAFHERQ